MKIIPNQQKNNAENKNELGKELTLVKGSKFSAKVISVAGNNVVVELDGKSGKLKVSGFIQNGHNLTSNSLTNLEVLGSQKGKTLFGEMTQSTEGNRNTGLVNNSLKIPYNETTLSSEEWRTLNKILKEKGIPISKETMKLIATNKGFVDKIEMLLKGNDIHLGGKEMPKVIKQVVLDYFIERSKGKEGPENKSPVATAETKGLEKSVLVGERVVKVDGKVDVEIKGDHLIKGGNLDQNSKVLPTLLDDTNRKSLETTLETKQNLVVEKNSDVMKNQVEGKNLEFQKEVLKFLSEDVKTTLSSSNKLESLSMLLKNKMAFTLKNIVVSEKILVGEKSINGQLEDIKKLLSPKALLGMKSLPVDQLVDHKEINNYYKELLRILEKVIVDNNLQGDSKLESKVEILKNTLSFMDESEGRYNFMQIPINLNNREADLSIALKKEEKGKKKVDKNNAVIFISLNTNNLELIQSKIVVKNNKLDLNIRVLSPEIEAVILDQIGVLEERLAEMSFESVSASVTLNHSEKNFFQILTEEEHVGDHKFDIRV